MTGQGSSIDGGRGPGQADGLSARLRNLVANDSLVLAAILILAAALRLIGLETRGRFDGDQGHDVLVLLQLVRDGALPLLGPPTSIGDFHHGAAYYYLLAPAAWLGGADPTVVVAWIAILGIAAVAATWWLGRLLGGPVVAAIAGLVMAVSPAAIEESTFIWNPNPIPLFAALALGCAWRAHAGATAQAARWWIPAVLSAGVVFQLHVLGIVFLPPILALALVDARVARRAGDPAQLRAIVRSVAAGLVLVALLFVPLLASELGSGFEETRHVLDYLAGGSGESIDRSPVLQVAITLLRLVGWPLVGLVTDAPFAALVAVVVTITLGAWLALTGRGPERAVARWLGLTVAWSALALTLAAPSLQTVVAGLPNDHYHAYLDPVVIVLLALGLRAVARGPERSADARVHGAARAIAAVSLGGLVLVALVLAPPRDPNGGWPAARTAGARIVELAGPGEIDIRQLPVFKSAEGVGFPVIVAGGDPVIATDEVAADRMVDPDATLVVACDRLFEDVMGAACGGPAEGAYLERLRLDIRHYRPAVRFDLSARISISIYQPISKPAVGG